MRKKSESNRIINQMIEFISQNYKENISLRDVASHFGYEYHYISRYLSKSVRTNFRVLLNQYRLEHAKTMLLNSSVNGDGVSITKIALDSGFQSIRTFNRAFMNYTGTEPRKYLNSLNSYSEVGQDE